MFRSLVSISRRAATTPAARAALTVPVRHNSHSLSKIIDLAFMEVQNDGEYDYIYRKNKKTGEVEPLVLPATEFTVEFLMSSPNDEHCFEVMPVIKECPGTFMNEYTPEEIEEFYKNVAQPMNDTRQKNLKALYDSKEYVQYSKTDDHHHH